MVVDDRGTRLPGVTVFLKGTSGVERASVTSARGEYEFKELPVGKYELAATFAEFISPPARLVEVDGGSVTASPLILRIDPDLKYRVVGAEGDPQVQVDRKTPVPR